MKKKYLTSARTLLYVRSIMSSVITMMEVLGITIGNNLFNFSVEAMRIQYSERSLIEKAKEALILARKLEEEDNVNVKEQFYGPGIAN